MLDLVEKEQAACVRFDLCGSIAVVAWPSDLRPSFLIIRVCLCHLSVTLMKQV